MVLESTLINIQLSSIIFTILNLIILFLLLKKFLIGPINKVIAEREKMISSTIAGANQTKSDAEKLKAQYEASLAKTQAECETMRENSRKEAQREYIKVVDLANEKATKMIKDAENTISLEQEKALSNMESQIAGLAMDAAAKILSDNTDDSRNKSLYDEFLEKAGDAHDSENH